MLTTNLAYDLCGSNPPLFGARPDGADALRSAIEDFAASEFTPAVAIAVPGRG